MLSRIRVTGKAKKGRTKKQQQAATAAAEKAVSRPDESCPSNYDVFDVTLLGTPTSWRATTVREQAVARSLISSTKATMVTAVAACGQDDWWLLHKVPLHSDIIMLPF